MAKSRKQRLCDSIILFSIHGLLELSLWGWFCPHQSRWWAHWHYQISDRFRWGFSRISLSLVGWHSPGLAGGYSGLSSAFMEAREMDAGGGTSTYGWWPCHPGCSVDAEIFVQLMSPFRPFSCFEADVAKGCVTSNEYIAHLLNFHPGNGFSFSFGIEWNLLFFCSADASGLRLLGRSHQRLCNENIHILK